MEIFEPTDLFTEKQQNTTAKKQREMFKLILKTYSTQWFTREALRREYFKRTGQEIPIASASRTLSNLTAVPCAYCTKIFSQTETKHQGCGKHQEQYMAWPNIIEPPVIKSDGALFRGGSGPRVHAWKWNSEHRPR